MTTAFIALGSNLGDRATLLATALGQMAETPGIVLGQTSRMLTNPAIGGPAGSPEFLNAVVEIKTTLDPAELLYALLSIEKSLGRERREKWAPRTIDLDLILYGNQVIDQPNLRVPHPLMHKRRFVLEPMVEIAAEVVHPILKQTMRQLLAAL